MNVSKKYLKRFCFRRLNYDTCYFCPIRISNQRVFGQKVESFSDLLRNHPRPVFRHRWIEIRYRKKSSCKISPKISRTRLFLLLLPSVQFR